MAVEIVITKFRFDVIPVQKIIIVVIPDDG